MGHSQRAEADKNVMKLIITGDQTWAQAATVAVKVKVVPKTKKSERSH